MSDKIVDLMKYNYVSQSSELLSANRIMDMLSDIFSKDEEAVWDSIGCYGKLEKDIGSFREILSCASNRSRCESMILALDPEQLTHFSRIVMSLRDAVELKDFSNVREATFNLNTPTESSIKKAATLLDMNKKIDVKDFDGIIVGLFKFSNQIKHLAEFYYNYKNKQDDEQWTNGLARLPEGDLDHLIFLSKLTLENRGYSDEVK